MSREIMFFAMTGLAGSIWLIWIAAPTGVWSERFAHEPLIWFGLGAIYASLLLAAALDGLPDGAGFLTLDDLRLTFTSEWALLAGWAHFLAFDLFVGGWMVRDAPQRGYRLAAPLVLTMLVGPLGLTLYLARRAWFQGRAAHAPTGQS